MADERSSIAQPVWQSPASKARRSLLLGAGVLAGALLAAFWPEYAGLEPIARRALFILFLAAGLWISEAIPAFAVALLVMALEILLLGAPSAADSEWHVYLATWGSPLIWLFFGGFVLAGSAAKTGLDRIIAVRVLRAFGGRPVWLLLGTMTMTFVFSLFMSNTATAAMMLAVLVPLISPLDKSDPLGKALLLGVAVGANVGGMGTLIGSPPNAIAAGALADIAPISFNAWIVYGLPPALLLLVGSWLWFVVRYPLRQDRPAAVALPALPANPAGRWRLAVVSLTCFATVGLWMTGAWHGLPTAVVSLLPVCVFTTFGLWTANDMRSIPWEVLLLIAGGLSLGVGIERTGLAAWFVAQFPTESIPWWGVSLMFAYVTVLLSNLMSNTAAATIMVPMALAVSAAGHETAGVVPIALSASVGMCLPISTPPNAIVYSTERLKPADFIQIGLLLNLAAPPLMVAWCAWVAR